MSAGTQAALATRLRKLAARLKDRTLPPELEATLREVLDACDRMEALPRNDIGSANGGTPGGGGELVAKLTLSADEPIRIWCDGSCAPNPGPGGWAAIVEQGGRRMEISGASPESTNNIMEMTAALEALRLTPPGAHALVVTDSRYLMDGITKWIPGWKQRGWLTAERKPVKNQGLWQALDALVQERTVRWEWVEGHSGQPENERCDELANTARLAQ